jgi:hypothetical protein
MLSEAINPITMMANLVDGEQCRVLCVGPNRLILLRKNGNVREVVLEDGIITECINIIVSREAPSYV